MLPRLALAAVVLALPVIAAPAAGAAPLVFDRFDEPTGPETMTVVAGDFSGDGLGEFAVAIDGQNSVKIHLAFSDGTFLPRDARRLPAGGNPTGLAAADLDGDGDLDVAATDTVNDVVVPILNRGDIYLTVQPAVPVGDTPWSVAAGDLNGDGKVDLVTADRALSAAAGTVSVLLGTGGGAFAPAVSYAAGASPDAVALGDTDEDGDLDLAVANRVSNTVMVRRNAGNGSFGAAHTRAVGTRPSGITAADLDADGDADLATANTGSENVTVLRSAGNGTFAAAATYSSMGSLPMAVKVGDLDGDSLADLVVVNSGSVSVRSGTGAGAFGAASTHAVGGGSRSLDLADLDGDGRLDVVTGNDNDVHTSGVSVLMQPVAPTLAAAPFIYDAPAQGTVSYADRGYWNGTRARFAFEWLRCGDLYLRSCAPIGTEDATDGRSYTPTAEDSGKRLRLKVTASNGAGSATSTSAASKIVDRPYLVTGARLGTITPRTGAQAWAHPANFSGYQLELAFTWLRCDRAGSNCAAIAGPDATDDADYTPTTADRGFTLRLRMTATNSLGRATSTTPSSRPVDAPVMTSTPKITGTAQVGQTLHAAPGAWIGQGITFTYSWLRCNGAGTGCAAIGTAAAAQQDYQPVAADAGHRLRVHVKATNTYGWTSVNSAASRVIASAP